MNETAFPTGGRRVIFYLLFDERGDVDDYIPWKLERLRPFAEQIIVIVNGRVSAEGHERLAGVSDEVWERENVGFDVGGYKWALERFGEARLAEFDELILMNYTWFGPVRPLEPLFERMDALEVGFWGLTDHGPVPETDDGKPALPAHIQSHWIAVRRSLFLTDEWRSYWRDMPLITSYDESIRQHEARFAAHFDGLGHAFSVAFPYSDYGTDHPAFLNARELLDDGNPAIKRRPFFHDPLYLDREGIVGRWLVDAAVSHGYPERFIWQSMTRGASAKVLYTNASMMEILPTPALAYDPTRPLSIVAVVHIYYVDMADELLDRLATLPADYDLVATTDTEEKAEQIRAAIARRGDEHLAHSEVRVVASNRGRDQSAFYVTSRDVLVDGRYDIVVKIHSKRSVQDGEAGVLFKRQQLENLLDSPEYASSVLGLFQREPGLGVVYAPMIHIGYPTMGNAWFTNRPLAKQLAERLGIKVHLDTSSPLAPYGGMFIARTAALRPLTAEQWSFDEYPPEGEYADGTLAHAQERLVSYAVAETGHHTRTIATAEYAAISHTYLEYKLDQISQGVHGAAYDQVHQVRSVTRMLRGGRYAVVKYLLMRYYPGVARAGALLTKPLRRSRPDEGGNRP